MINTTMSLSVEGAKGERVGEEAAEGSRQQG